MLVNSILIVCETEDEAHRVMRKFKILKLLLKLIGKEAYHIQKKSLRYKPSVN